MAESKELDTLIFCLGPIGGQENPVFTKESTFASKDDYTTIGYARYIEEANNVIKFQYLVINYFLESVKSQFEEDPLAFIDAEDEEDLLASIQKMKKQWRDMFKEHQKKLKETLRNQKQAMEQAPDEERGSSAKIPRLDPEAATGAASEIPEKATGASLEAGVPEGKVPVPESFFLNRAKAIARVLKSEYQELRARMGKALDRIACSETVHDLKGFSWQHMEKFAKWKYDLKTLGHLVPDLESKLNELDLDFDKIKENENRLEEWMYFDDGKKDRKYHHRLLLTMDLAVSVAEISTLAWKQIKRWRKLSKSLQTKLPPESEAFEEKVKQWRREVVRHSPMKKTFQPQQSTDSDDTLFGTDEMPEET